jgi:hypothetical protein
VLARASILTTVEAALEASATFTGMACITDDGTVKDSVEAQLNSIGAVLVLPPVVTVDPREQAGGSAAMDATFVVRILISPETNSTQTTPRVFETLRAGVVDTLLAVAGDTHGDRFEFVNDKLSEIDPGLLAADLTFKIGCQSNPL